MFHLLRPKTSRMLQAFHRLIDNACCAGCRPGLLRYSHSLTALALLVHSQSPVADNKFIQSYIR